MKKILAIYLLITLIIYNNPIIFSQMQANNIYSHAVNSVHKQQNIIVTFKDQIDRNIIEKINGTIVKEYENISTVVIAVSDEAIEHLSKNTNVISIETDAKVETMSQIQTMSQVQIMSQVQVMSQVQDWGIRRTEAVKAWEHGYTGKGVKIAIIDSGISNHEDLIIAGGISFTSYTNSYLDDNGHGTFVAGIIGASNNQLGTIGIASEAELYAVKVMAQDGMGYMSDIIAGIDWAITNKMDIINLSVGSDISTEALNQIVQKAYNQGILVVAAAGNSGIEEGIGDNVNYPARLDAVIAVAATDSNDKRAFFSSTGNSIEVAAPGVNIISTYLNNQYAYMSGTSLAAPYVSGNLALLKQAYPRLTNEELREILRNTAIDLGDLGRDIWYGYGLIQAPKEQVMSIETAKDHTSTNSDNNGASNNANSENNSGTIDGTNNTTKQEKEQTETIDKTDTSKPIVLGTVTVLSTDKKSYKAGKNVNIKAVITDKNGKKIKGAKVKVTITPPRGKKIVSTIKTDSKGQAKYVYATKAKSVKGKYTILVETTYSNYKSSKAKTTIQIK